MTRSVHAWLIFTALAAIPAAIVLALVVRAASAERARAHEDQLEARRTAAAAATREISASFARAKDALRAASDEGSPEALASVLAAARPSFADVVVLAADGSLAVPPPPTSAANVAPECIAARGTLAGAERERARAIVVERCPELRAESGRWLWPLLALEGTPRASAEVAEWIERHADRLGAAERGVLRDRIGVLGAAERERALVALDRESSPRDVLVAVAPDLGYADEVEGSVRTHRGKALTIARAFASGLTAGYVAHEGSRTRLPLPAALVAVNGSVSDGTDVRLTPQLVFHVEARDTTAAERLARRSGDRVLALGTACVLLSCVLAAALFARAQRAQRLAELRTDFVAAVSHELRTPLASVRMLAELLERKDVDESERAEVEHTLAEEARRMSATLDRMLRFGALARGKLVAQKERIALGPVVDEAVARFRGARADRAVVVKLEEDLEADADAGLLGLVLDNLLSNAAKYAPDGGPYRVVARRQGSDVELAVSDRGPGLDAAARARVFLPFERADDRLSRATEGTGVGLALVRGIARAHGGDATVQSEPGQGATFVVRFPSKRESA